MLGAPDDARLVLRRVPAGGAVAHGAGEPLAAVGADGKAAFPAVARRARRARHGISRPCDVAVRAAVLQLRDGHLERRIGRHHLVGHGERVPRAHLAGVGRIVQEVLVGQRAVLVADEPVALDLGWVELQLQLHVVGQRGEVRQQVAAEHAPGLFGAVDVVVGAVAVVGQHLHLGVLVVSRAEPEHR